MAQFIPHVNPGVEAGDAIRQAIALQEAKRMQVEALQRQAQLDSEKVRQFNVSNSLNERQVANAEMGTKMKQGEMDLAAKDRAELMSMLNPQPEEGTVGVQSPIPAKPVGGMGSVSMSPNPITVKGLRPAQSNGIPENVRKSVLLQLHGANVPASAFNEPKPENTSDYQDKLSRYAAGIGKTLQTLTTEDQLAFDKKQADATRAETDPTLAALREATLAMVRRNNSGDITQGQVSMANGLRDDFNRESSDFFTRQNQFRVIKSVVEQPASAAGDLSLIFAYMKMLDPPSVVREGEQATAANARGVPERITSLYNRLITGERLTPGQRQDFVNQANTQYRAFLKDQQRRLDRYKQRAKGINVPESYIVAEPDPDLSQPEPAAPVATATTTQPSRGRGGKPIVEPVN